MKKEDVTKELEEIQKKIDKEYEKFEKMELDKYYEKPEKKED